MKSKESDFTKIIETLTKYEVEFIIVGGVCAVLHGVPVTTFDLDIVHNRSTENIERLLNALRELEAYYRIRSDIQIEPDKSGLALPGHHLLITNAGPLDVLGTIGESEDYSDLIKDVGVIEISGKKVQLQGLESLIKIKKFLGAEKDRAVIPVLQRTLEEKKKQRKDSTNNV